MPRKTSRASNASSKKRLADRSEAGRWLRSLREKAGLTQADIEHRLGLSSTFVSTIENGRHALPIDRYADYADALGVRARPFVLAALRFYHPTIAATLSPAKS